jgi:Polysaccharide pyruvyl transferase
MKIGILTYTREYANLGTNMQAYCTLQAIRRAYPDSQVELVDYCPTSPSRRPYLTHISLHSIKLDYRRFRKYDDFFACNLAFSREALTTTALKRVLEFIRRQRYDVVYVGSDTVLEIKRGCKDALTPYWLDSSISSTKILAAASSFNVTYETLSKHQQDLMQASIDAFALLGVRDDATFRLLSRFTTPGDPRLQIVPDPTFTYDIDYRYIEQYMARNRLSFPRPLVCLHLLRDSYWAADLATAFRKAGFIVASLRPARYADVIFTDLSPFEQIGLYRYFSLVVTHRFHDAIFCLKNLTPVLAFPPQLSDVTSYSESKIDSLFRVFGVESSCYISNKDGVSAKSILDRYPCAISQVVEGRPRIIPLLREQKARYQQFIDMSRQLVESESREECRSSLHHRH